MNRQERPAIVVVQSGILGWIALVGAGDVLRRLSFGHASKMEALDALEPELVAGARPGDWNEPLLRQIGQFAAGEAVDFRDVRIDLSGMSDFRRRVVRQCRQISYGRTMTYGQLAAKAGSPRAARAVGSCMAANRYPLIVPCHRVLPADGRIGAFSAPGGPEMKRRLLAVEAAEHTV